MEPDNDLAKASLVQALRRVLNHLYDPTVLHDSVLVELLGADQHRNPTAALRQTMIGAIQSLKPENSVPSSSNAWRVYRLLHYRYVEQFTQRDVAADLSLSIRQLRRQETRALEVLAGALWSQYNLEARIDLLRAASAEGETSAIPANTDASARTSELERLKSSVPREPVSLIEMTTSILDTLEPLIETARTRITCELDDDLPMLVVQHITMRQALLDLIAGAIRRVPEGGIIIDAQADVRQVCVHIEAVPSPAVEKTAGERAVEPSEWSLGNLTMVQQLVEISGGTLQIQENLTVELVLPAVEQATVLCIDDNDDTLRLWQKYLHGTRYRFVGTTEPQEALDLAQQWSPKAIVLDIMLPQVDGWELLARLREHPRTRDIPVIVCTILPEQELAVLLGAADFYRKPVTQQELLCALDRWVRPLQPTECE